MERFGTRKADELIDFANLHWAAGFLEGDGSFQLAGRGMHTPIVSCSQVNEEPIRRLHQLFGGNVRSRQPQNPNWKKQLIWQVNSSRAVGVMLTLFCLMTAKRKKQILMALGRLPYEFQGRKPS